MLISPRFSPTMLLVCVIFAVFIFFFKFINKTFFSKQKVLQYVPKELQFTLLHSTKHSLVTLAKFMTSRWRNFLFNICFQTSYAALSWWSFFSLFCYTCLTVPSVAVSYTKKCLNWYVLRFSKHFDTAFSEKVSSKMLIEKSWLNV